MKKKNLKIINRQEYEKVKKEMEKFREKHNIHKSEEELVQEDNELKKRFGID